MSHTRRVFLSAAFTAAAMSAFGAAQQFPPQNGRTTPGPPYPPDPLGPLPSPPKPNPRLVLKANQEEIKKDVARLSEAVADLQKSLENNDTKEVLSLDVVHKTDEIEKLAKQIRSLVRG